MREESNAICTSLEPVSFSWERLSSMMFVLSICLVILYKGSLHGELARANSRTSGEPLRRSVLKSKD